MYFQTPLAQPQEEPSDAFELFTGPTLLHKLKDAKTIVESLEKDIFKLRVEIKRSESTVHKLQEAQSLNSQNQNNTSSNFTLPSEFKKNWEIMVQESILDVFTIFLNRHYELSHLVRGLFQVVYKRIEQNVNSKLQEICKIFALPEQSTDGLRKFFLKLLQDQCKILFPCPEIESVKIDYYDAVKDFIEEDSIKDFEDMVEMNEFSDFVKSVHSLCVFMLLSEPTLTVPFVEQLDYRVFKNEDYYCIDGFPKNSLPCVVILPPAMRHNFAYQGLKPAILILSRDVAQLTPEEQTMKTEKIKSSLILKEVQPMIPSVSQAHQETHQISDESFLEEIKNSFQQSPYKKVRSEIIIPSPSKIPKSDNQVLQDISRNMIIQNSAGSLVEMTHQVDIIEHSDKTMTESPSRGNTSKEISPRKVIDRYSKLKYKLKNLQSNKPYSQNSSYFDDEDRYSLPLQRKSPFPVTDKKQSINHEASKRHSLTHTHQIENEDIPISAATQAALQRKRAENSCAVCKPKVPCDKCYNSKLLAMARKLPISALYTSKYKPSKVHRASLYESPSRSEGTKVMTSALSQKLSEVSKKALMNSNSKSKPVERETCKVI